MARYFVHYTVSKDGQPGDGNCELNLDKPIRGIADVKAIAQVISDSLPGNTSVVVAAWQRFED